MRILLAEDDPDSRIFLESVLSEYGRCDAAANGYECTAYIAGIVESTGAFYDLVCIDIMFPQINGIELLKAIRDTEKKIGCPRAKIIMVTALSDRKTVRECYSLGCDDFLTKPVDRKTLKESLAKLGIE